MHDRRWIAEVEKAVILFGFGKDIIFYANNKDVCVKLVVIRLPITGDIWIMEPMMNLRHLEWAVL